MESLLFFGNHNARKNIDVRAVKNFKFGVME